MYNVGIYTKTVVYNFLEQSDLNKQLWGFFKKSDS